MGDWDPELIPPGVPCGKEELRFFPFLVVSICHFHTHHCYVIHC